MTDEIHPVNPAHNGDYERSDIGIAGVLYFLAGLGLAVALVYFAVDGLYSYLDKRSEAEQTPVNPLVMNAPKDTRRISRGYPEEAFPAPRLEEDERGQLNSIRLKEEQTLSSYDYIDQNAGTVRIPIERAMELIAQRGLPVRNQERNQATAAEAPAMATAKSTPEKEKEKKKTKTNK